MSEFQHLIEVDQENETIKIFRMDCKGNKILYTESKIPKINNIEQESKVFEDFARMLGENILLDFPSVRKLLKIE